MGLSIVNIWTICRINVFEIDLNETVQESLFTSYATTQPFQFTLTIFSLLIGLGGLSANLITLVVCANRIMWERSYSRYIAAFVVFDILLLIMTMLGNIDLNITCKIEYYLSGLMGLGKTLSQ